MSHMDARCFPGFYEKTRSSFACTRAVNEYKRLQYIVDILRFKIDLVKYVTERGDHKNSRISLYLRDKRVFKDYDISSFGSAATAVFLVLHFPRFDFLKNDGK